MFARGGIRTHEAEAVDLKSTPFDRSGTLACTPPGTRTQNLSIRSRTRYPIAPVGLVFLQGLEPWTTAS